MTIRIPLNYGRKYFTFISAYAPTMTNPNDIKDKFYEDLHAANFSHCPCFWYTQQN